MKEPEAAGVEGTPWGPLFRRGVFPVPSSLVLYGRAGSGKTRAMLRLAECFRPALIVTLEMTAVEMVGVCKELGVPLDGLWFHESPSWQAEADRIRARMVGVDSLGALYRPVSFTRAARDWSVATGSTVVMVGHANAAGRAKGDTGVQHWPTVVVEARARSGGRVELSTPHKNRHGPTGPNRPKILVQVADAQPAARVKQAQGGGSTVSGSTSSKRRRSRHARDPNPSSSRVRPIR